MANLPYYQDANVRSLRKGATKAMGVQIVENTRDLGDLIDTITCIYDARNTINVNVYYITFAGESCDL